MEKIDNQQLNKLIATIEKYGIRNEWVLNICNIDKLSDLNIRQYNFLLLLIQEVSF